MRQGIAEPTNVWYNADMEGGGKYGMEYANAARFLKSYNRIENQLKILYNARPTQNFTDLVKRCTDRNLTVRRYENELVDYGKLRNAIVHHSGESGEMFIANPCDEVVETIEYIERQLCNPPLVTDVFKVKKVATVFSDKPLLTAVEKFAESHQKTILVYDHGKMAGLINCYCLYQAIADCVKCGGNASEYLKNTLCGDVIDEKQLEKYLILDKSATVFDVFEAFEKNKALFAVIITENGVVGEKAILLITPSDFPIINRYLESTSTKSF